MLTASRLKELLHYDPESGAFTWKVHRNGRALQGQVAGTVLVRDGYRRIVIDGRYYTAGRLACLYMTGAMPARIVDHEDRERNNNRWNNIRPCTHQMNNANSATINPSGYRGVGKYGNEKRWRSQITHNKKTIYLGWFDDPTEAARAYDVAAAGFFGAFATLNYPTHGKPAQAGQ